jgi:hypothetical protein
MARGDNIMRELSPTLVRTASDTGLATATGSTAELDFDFGIQQGARLIGIEYSFNITAGTHVGGSFGLYLGPTRSNPTTVSEVMEDEDVVGSVSWQINQEAAGEQVIQSIYRDFSRMEIYITRNVRGCVYNWGSTNLNLIVWKLYYNRIELSAEEAVVQMTIRR